MNTSDTPKTRAVADTAETISLFLSLTSVSIMSLLFGRKTADISLRSINYVRGLVVSLHVVSWAFSFAAALLVQTNNYNLLSCQLAIFLCIVLYASSKVIIYLFLIERVHIVTAIWITRWNCPMFKLNMALLLPYIAMFVLAIIYRVAELTDDGTCYIGLLYESAVPLIAYDTFISSWLTILFLRALLSSTSVLQGPTKSKLREVAWRALLGSTLALVLSTADVSSQIYFKGHARGLICLALCTLDVTLNAITIHWATSHGNSNSKRANSDRASSDGGDGPQFPLQGNDNQVSPPIESYAEEYHQIHLANTVQLHRNQ